jgi:hypothetical protein
VNELKMIADLLTEPPPAEEAVARGRARLTTLMSAPPAIRRGHRRLAAGIIAAAAAAAVVLGLGLSGALGAAPNGGTGTIRTAASTVVEHANGTATVTVNNADQLLMDPSALQSALQQDGIPALVTAGSFCSSDPVPAGLLQVVVLRHLFAPYSPVLPGSTGPASTGGSLTINPAVMRAGTELSFGIFQLPSLSRIEAIIELVDTNSYTCTSTAPPAPPPGEGDTVVFQQYVPAGS